MFVVAAVMGLLKVPNRADLPKIPARTLRTILGVMAMPDGSSGPKWTALFEKVVAELGDSDHATAGKMSGMPCGNIGARLLPGSTRTTWSSSWVATPRQGPGAGRCHLFDPSGMGRAMKEWVVVPNKHSATWPEVGRKALVYVAAKKK